MTRHRALTAVALTAAAVALSTGGAVAGARITGAQIQDGTITTKDVKNGSLLAADLKPSAVKTFSRPGPRGATGPRGAAGAPGSARAFGRVFSDGTVAQGSPGVEVRRPQTGLACISAPSVEPATSVAVVSADYTYGSTGTYSQSVIEFTGASPSCLATELAVRTFVRTFQLTGGELTGTALTPNNEPFVFVIP